MGRQPRVQQDFMSLQSWRCLSRRAISVSQTARAYLDKYRLPRSALAMKSTTTVHRTESGRRSAQRVALEPWHESRVSAVNTVRRQRQPKVSQPCCRRKHCPLPCHLRTETGRGSQLQTLYCSASRTIMFPRLLLYECEPKLFIIPTKSIGQQRQNKKKEKE